MNATGDNDPIPVPFHEFVRIRDEEIVSQENGYYAGLAVGRPPSYEDKFTHYMEHGFRNLLRRFFIASF